MKKLILHIGTHKTATTAIQNTLAAERDALLEQSVLYASTSRPPDLDLPKHASLFASMVESDEAFEKEKNIILEEFENSGCETLILSEERLSFPMFEEFSKLKEFSEHFEISVICYFRRPDMLLESLWNQHSKNGIEKRNILQFSQNPFSIRCVEYGKILKFWADFAEVKPVCFETAKKDGVAATFAREAGITLGQEAPAINVSPSMNCAVILSSLNRQELDYNKPRLLSAFREDKGKYALGSKRRAELLEYLKPDLEVLEQDFGLTFDLTMPEEREAPLLRPSPDALAKAFAYLCPKNA